MKVLLVEDQPEIRQLITDHIASAVLNCEIAKNYQSASLKIGLYEYDLVILDLNLPDGNGLDLLKELKSRNLSTGTIIISARNSVSQKIEGLRLGADDYLTKPFDVAELMARIQAVYRRKYFDGHQHIHYKNLTVNSQEKRVFVDEQEVILTKSEYKILLFLLANKSRVLTKETLAEHLMGDDMDLIDSFDFVYTHIKNLRKKLMHLGMENPIKVMYGLGYKLEE